MIPTPIVGALVGLQTLAQRAGKEIGASLNSFSLVTVNASRLLAVNAWSSFTL